MGEGGLLLRGAGLVKTTHLKDPKYVGDPINTIKFVNEKEVDELVLLDVSSPTGSTSVRLDVRLGTTSGCSVPFQRTLFR
jgi:imidazole glycerol-phosphate synthase subunit HisF